MRRLSARRYMAAVVCGALYVLVEAALLTFLVTLSSLELAVIG
jgi:predicted benzoate:H+ symporter BenE